MISTEQFTPPGPPTTMLEILCAIHINFIFQSAKTVFTVYSLLSNVFKEAFVLSFSNPLFVYICLSSSCDELICICSYEDEPPEPAIEVCIGYSFTIYVLIVFADMINWINISFIKEGMEEDQENNNEDTPDDVVGDAEEKEQETVERPRKTTKYMTKYERARILGTRALQIRFGTSVSNI